MAGLRSDSGSGFGSSRAGVLGLLLFLMLCACGVPRLSAQAPAKWKPTDTIELTSGKKIVCMMRSTTSKKIYYYADSLMTERAFSRRNVYRITYGDGRAEKINDKAVMTVEGDDYRTVIIVEDKEDVEGLYSLGVVVGDSGKSNRTMSSAKRNAETRLKKRAVAKGAIFVLVTKRTSTGGYGEIPTYVIEGEAFGTEPPETSDSVADAGKEGSDN